METRADLAAYTRGAVVMKNAALFEQDEMIGHIDGFTRNAVGEPILKVLWEDGTISSIHPHQVRLNPIMWPGTWSEEKCFQKMRQADEQRELADRAPKVPSLLRRFFTLSA